MNDFIFQNSNKIKNWLLLILTLGLLLTGGYTLFLVNLNHDQSIALTAKDAELQRAKLDIGLSESKLVKAKDLEKELRQELRGMENEFKRLVEEYRLKIKSKDRTILSLRKRVTGGTTTVVVHNGNDGRADPGTLQPCEDGTCPPINKTALSYTWTGPHKRFKLFDPNIWIEGNEVFESKQYLKIEGYIFEAKEGQLQTRKLTVKEVDESGKEIPGGEIEILESTFTYANRAVENRKAGLFDIVTIRPYASFDTALTPGIGVELFNIGRYFPYANIGLGPYLAADVSNPLRGSLQRSRIGLHAQYQLFPPLLETNVAIGIGIGVPFNNLFGPVFTGSLIFYFTPDLNPFSFWKDRPEIFGIKL